jgi:outer membrane murein-binding lipoprotein Lpp
MVPKGSIILKSAKVADQNEAIRLPPQLNMPDLPPAQRSSSKALVASLVVSQIVVAGVAVYSIFHVTKPDAKIASLSGQIASLTAQLDDSQKEIAELRARTMPITLRIDRDAINAGYNLYVYNQARTSFRIHYMVRGNEGRGSKITRAVIDGGRFIIIPGLAWGDVVNINCEGYDDKSVTIK